MKTAKTPASIHDPSYWRARAEEARKLAKDMPDAVSHNMMLQIADNYESLAKRAKALSK